jgi:hypothetical protein
MVPKSRNRYSEKTMRHQQWLSAGTEKGTAMGEVIRFPDEAGSVRGGRYVDANNEPATVIILPVIRIERLPDGSNGLEPDTGNSSGRRRRRRIAR